MIVQRIVIAQHERGFVLKDKRIQEFLMPGIYWRLSYGAKLEVLDIRNPVILNGAIRTRCGLVPTTL